MTPNEQAARDALANIGSVLDGLRQNVTATIKMLETPPVDPGLITVDTSGTVNVTAAIQAFLNKAASATPDKRMAFTIPAGNYLVDAVTGLWPKDNCVINVDSEARFQVIPNDEPDARLWRFYHIMNVDFTGGRYYGDRDTHNYRPIYLANGVTLSSKSTHEWGHCFGIGGCKNVSITQTYIEGFGGDGFSIGAYKEGGVWTRSQNIFIGFNEIVDCRRQGISATNVDGYTIRGNKIRNIGVTNGTSPRCGIDCEPDNDEVKDQLGNITKPGTAAGRNSNGVIEKNDITGCAVYGINVFLRVDDLKVDSNFIHDNHSCGIVCVNGLRPKFTNNSISKNYREGLFIKPGTSDYLVNGNVFTLNYQAQSPQERTTSLVAAGKQAGTGRDLNIATGATGSVLTNTYR